MGIQVTLSLESPHLVAHRWMHCESVSIAPVCAPIKWIIIFRTSPQAGAILGMDLDNLILNEPCEVGSIFNPTLKMNKVSHRVYKSFGQCHTGLTLHLVLTTLTPLPPGITVGLHESPFYCEDTGGQG